jgi:hypothetical protein
MSAKIAGYPNTIWQKWLDENADENINAELSSAIRATAAKIEDCFCRSHESRDDRLKEIQYLLFDLTSWALPLKPEKPHP